MHRVELVALDDVLEVIEGGAVCADRVCDFGCFANHQEECAGASDAHVFAVFVSWVGIQQGIEKRLKLECEFDAGLLKERRTRFFPLVDFDELGSFVCACDCCSEISTNLQLSKRRKHD